MGACEDHLARRTLNLVEIDRERNSDTTHTRLHIRLIDDHDRQDWLDSNRWQRAGVLGRGVTI